MHRTTPRLPTSLFLLVSLSLLASLSAAPAAADPFLLQSPNIGRTENLGLELYTEAGWEAGPIPDWFASHGVTLGLFDFLCVDLHAAWGGFPGMDPVRLDTAGADLCLKLLSSPAVDLQAFAGGQLFIGPPIFIPYAGSLPEVAYALSPRAEGGFDITAGLAGGWRPRPEGFGLFADASASYTGGRSAFDPLTEPDTIVRVRADICPAWCAASGFSFLAQNRFTWWFSRGWMYDVLPEVCVEPLPGLRIAAGGVVPAVGGGAWSLIAGVRWAPQGTPPPVRSRFVETVKDGASTRLRLYLTFLGDRADLFAPRNAKHGEENRRILLEVASYLKQFKGCAIVVEGHTNRARFAMSFEREQKEEMLPLAAARAQAVLDALVGLGVDRASLRAVAIGGLRPLAKFEDSVNNWRNRRVEIVITRK
jgi:hypothetical protein